MHRRSRPLKVGARGGTSLGSEAQNSCILPPCAPAAVPATWHAAASPTNRISVCSTAPAPTAAAFLPYLQREMAAVNDSSLQQEVDLLNKLIAL